MNLYLVSRSFETGILFNRSISKRRVEHDTFFVLRRRVARLFGIKLSKDVTIHWPIETS